jgi:hypothetical protein
MIVRADGASATGVASVSGAVRGAVAVSSVIGEISAFC